MELKESDEKHAKDKDGEGKKKEQSVLQAKLTKLALQIGYGGKYLRFICHFFRGFFGPQSAQFN
jgi:hypothetical protein